MTATRAAGKVPESVIAFWRRKGLKPAFSWADVWKQEHLVAFTVAGLMEKDVLADMRAAVDRALAEGQSFEKFRKQTRAMLADAGWLQRKTVEDPITGEKKDVDLGQPHRLATIFDTNVRSARSAGQWGRIERTKDVLPYIEYMLGPSIKHREDHVPFAGTILPVGHPFWRTHWFPNGFGCKCHGRQITRAEAARKGGVSPDPDVSPVEWTHPRTGARLMVPRGCDPGFDYNPGIDRLKGLRAAKKGR